MLNIKHPKTILIGDINVNRIGLGTNRIINSAISHKLLKHAVEIGINFIDTANIYQDGESERGIAAALNPFPSNLCLATKGGMTKAGRGAEGHAEHLRKFLDESLQRLQLEQITLYQLHRVDPEVPIEESVKTLKQLQQEGKIKYIGLSEVTVEQLKKARQIADIISVQNRYNLMDRSYEAVVEYCTKHQIVFMPWYPLGGRDTGIRNDLSVMLNKIASQYQATPQQIAIAWLLQRSPMMLPIPGTLSLQHVEENFAALDILLSEEHYHVLENSI